MIHDDLTHQVIYDNRAGEICYRRRCPKLL